VTETNASLHKTTYAAPRAVASVPPIGAPRAGFWQRWKEWERDHGTVPAPVRNRAA
jgi:hypothetical protein